MQLKIAPNSLAWRDPVKFSWSRATSEVEHRLCSLHTCYLALLHLPLSPLISTHSWSNSWQVFLFSWNQLSKEIPYKCSLVKRIIIPHPKVHTFTKLTNEDENKLQITQNLESLYSPRKPDYIFTKRTVHLIENM